MVKVQIPATEIIEVIKFNSETEQTFYQTFNNKKAKLARKKLYHYQLLFIFNFDRASYVNAWAVRIRINDMIFSPHHTSPDLFCSREHVVIDGRKDNIHDCKSHYTKLLKCIVIIAIKKVILVNDIINCFWVIINIKERWLKSVKNDRPRPIPMILTRFV